MKRFSASLVAGLFIATLGSVQAAGDPVAGQAKASQCAACHGADGVSFIPTYPNLNGQKAAYLVKQLKDFRSGVRQDPVMASQVQALSDEDIANLAAYYASLK